MLLPEFNSITKQQINEYQHGNKWILKTYTQLYDVIKHHEYKPNGIDCNEYQKFLFNEFKENVKFLTLTSAEKEQFIAYLRIKQKIESLRKK